MILVYIMDIGDREEDKLHICIISKSQQLVYINLRFAFATF